MNAFSLKKNVVCGLMFLVQLVYTSSWLARLLSTLVAGKVILTKKKDVKPPRQNITESLYSPPSH